MRRATAAVAAPLRLSRTGLACAHCFKLCSGGGQHAGESDKWLAAAPASHFFCAFWGFAKEDFMSTVPTSTNPPQVCWSCHERTLGTHFCASCGKLLQLPTTS